MGLGDVEVLGSEIRPLVGAFPIPGFVTNCRLRGEIRLGESLSPLFGAAASIKGCSGTNLAGSPVRSLARASVMILRFRVISSMRLYSDVLGHRSIG